MIEPREAAWLSELIYRDWSEVERAMAPAVFYTLRGHFDHAGSQGALISGRHWAALVFRGTQGADLKWSDILSNFTWPWPVRWQGPGRAHSGYIRHFNMIAADARALARGVSDHPVRLYAVGHSMGGCLATLYASWEPDQLDGLITFGAPKVLDRAAAAAIRCPVRRYVQPWDLAPIWPPFVGLVHPPGPPVVLTPARRWERPIQRHMIDSYRAALGRA